MHPAYQTASKGISKRALGVCYYPEHWAEHLWQDDAAAMVDAGITIVRIGEFAWSRIEPSPEKWVLDWLDRAIDVLGKAGLLVVLGTPTATPPRWLLDRYPDMLAHDVYGHVRGFGARRHYCFSHDAYRTEAARIALKLAEHYAHNPYLCAWQIDNEYGCHNTTLSYSPNAERAFRVWLQNKYGDIAALNAAWGNVFWSSEYDRFDQIGLPGRAVTVDNPAHALDFRRFSSAQVVGFHCAQVNAIRTHSNAPIIHNYMGRMTDFDHYDVTRNLDIVSWDSYPLGFLRDRIHNVTAHHKQEFLRQGDPDFQAFHHDLYRVMGQGRLWVMEQQAGAVNWASSNPAPLPGMVRLWTLEAYAHGAEAVCYFRWRQVPFGQEQMHSGLLSAASLPTAALSEVRAVANMINENNALHAMDTNHNSAPVAVIFDYPSMWAAQIQPQGSAFDYFDLVFDIYRGLRKLGLSIDIIPADTHDLSPYKMVFAPSLFHVPTVLQSAIEAYTGVFVAGPRYNTHIHNFTQRTNPRPPAVFGLDGVSLVHVESLPPDCPCALQKGGVLQYWAEHIDIARTANAHVVEWRADGAIALVRSTDKPTYYIAGWPSPCALQRWLLDICTEHTIDYIDDLPDPVRVRDCGTQRFVFNYSAEHTKFAGHTLPPAGAIIIAH